MNSKIKDTNQSKQFILGMFKMRKNLAKKAIGLGLVVTLLAGGKTELFGAHNANVLENGKQTKIEAPYCGVEEDSLLRDLSGSRSYVSLKKLVIMFIVSTLSMRKNQTLLQI